MQSRRSVMFTLAGAASMLAGSRAFAQAPSSPMVVYDSGLGSGWQSWSWAKVQMDVAVSDIKAIEAEGDPWTAVLLHHDAFSTASFSKLTFYVNGGMDGGQNLFLKTFNGNDVIEANYQIQPKVKTWNKVEVALTDLNAANKTITSVALQCGADYCKPYYINKMQFEA